MQCRSPHSPMPSYACALPWARSAILALTLASAIYLGAVLDRYWGGIQCRW
jgi:hypothetical protein